MIIAVRYFSKGGNTRKLAEAIAQEVGTEARDVSEDLTEKADMLFLANSVYGGLYDPAVGRFLERNAAKIGCVVNFSTSCTGRSTYAGVKALAGKLGGRVSDRHFVCKGHIWIFHKGRPDENDLAQARRFAADAVKG